MTCRELTDFLYEYLYGHLPTSVRTDFESHLAECPMCVAYLQNYMETIRLGKAAFSADGGPIPADVPEELIEAILGARSRES